MEDTLAAPSDTTPNAVTPYSRDVFALLAFLQIFPTVYAMMEPRMCIPAEIQGGGSVANFCVKSM